MTHSPDILRDCRTEHWILCCLQREKKMSNLLAEPSPRPKNWLSAFRVIITNNQQIYRISMRFPSNLWPDHVCFLLPHTMTSFTQASWAWCSFCFWKVPAVNSERTGAMLARLTLMQESSLEFPVIHALCWCLLFILLPAVPKGHSGNFCSSWIHSTWKVCFPLRIILRQNPKVCSVQLRYLWVVFCHLDVHESGAGPVSGAQHQGRHLQPGHHHHPHADWQPSLGPEVPTDCIPVLPLYCKFFFFLPLRTLTSLSVRWLVNLVKGISICTKLTWLLLSFRGVILACDM